MSAETNRKPSKKFLTAQEHVQRAESLVETAKKKLMAAGSIDAVQDLDEALEHLASAYRKTIQKGRAGFYAGRG